MTDPENKGLSLGYDRQIPNHAIPCEVPLNGSCLGEYEGGETAFCFDVTDSIRLDEENLLCVQALPAPAKRGKVSWCSTASPLWRISEHLQLTGCF